MPEATDTLRCDPASSRLTRRQWFLLASLLSLVFASYSLTLTYGFVYDDVPVIAESPHLQWRDAASYFTRSVWLDMPDSARFYRPLLLLWFLLNKSVFGLNPHAFHLTSVLLHVASTLMVFVFIRRVLGQAGPALVGAGFFGLHPLHVETVAWNCGANDSLATILCLAMALAFLQYRSKNKPLFLALSLLAFAAALLTKESVVLMPLVLWALPEDQECVTRIAPRPRALGAATGFVMIGGLYLLLRAYALGKIAAAHPEVTWATALSSIPAAGLSYLKKIAWPVGLSPHYAFAYIHSPWERGFLLPFAMGCAVGLGLYFWGRGSGTVGRTALLWSGLALAPALNLRWVNVGDPVHDRYLYISSAGISLFLAWTWQRIEGWEEVRWARLGLVLLAATFASLTAYQTIFWSSDGALFGRAVSVSPGSAWAHMNFGAALSHNNRHAEAYQQMVEGYRIEPSWRLALYAGLEAESLGHDEEAAAWYDKAAAFGADQPEVWFRLGVLRLRAHDPVAAEKLFRRALQLSPSSYGWHYMLGQALERQGKQAEAVEAYQRESQLHPDHMEAARATGRLHPATGDPSP